MLSNLPLDFVEYRPHDWRCATVCRWSDINATSRLTCPVHGRDHDCNCAGWHEHDIEEQAEALAAIAEAQGEAVAEGDGWYEDIARQRPATHSIRRPQ